jgi:flagellar L-ring protein precursor FlgH
MNHVRRWVLILLALGCGAPALAESLYKPGTYQALTSDLRQRKAGDLITVMVYETASATSTADTRSGRDADVGLGVQTPHRGYAAGIQARNHTDGGGQTRREGKVLAQITVAIREITDSGDLLVAGEQVLDINNETQQISVEGRIRPQDVSDANVVLSTRIANARIRYSGQGDLADKQRPAWWQRFLTLFGV